MAAQATSAVTAAADTQAVASWNMSGESRGPVQGAGGGGDEFRVRGSDAGGEAGNSGTGSHGVIFSRVGQCSDAIESSRLGTATATVTPPLQLTSVATLPAFPGAQGISADVLTTMSGMPTPIFAS